MDFVTPVGFRDVISQEASSREKIIAKVQNLFSGKGYQPIETPTLEILDVMEAGGHIPATPFKFFDSHGDLLAMRPDVTMQIARMCATRITHFDSPLLLRYTQRVFRENISEDKAREVTQIGVESIGNRGKNVDANLVSLFASALKACGLTSFKIALGSARVLKDLLSCSGASKNWQEQVLQAYHCSNYVSLYELTNLDEAIPIVARAIRMLPNLRGDRSALKQVRELLEPLHCEAGIDEIEAIYDELSKQGLEDTLLIDFSVVSSFDYYTGIVFEAYAPHMGTSLGSGGRYDNLLSHYGASNIPAAGFAFYLEQVMEALETSSEDISRKKSHPTLRIAIPKGSLNSDTISILQKAGCDVDGLIDSGRTLKLRNNDIEYIIVRPTDAPIFVALGAADCGICGKDSLVEQNADVVELVDLKYGKCRFVVAESKGSTKKVEQRYKKLGSIRIATKYPRITRWYFDKVGMQVEIMKLHGNIELAPITGLAERIVDITATGTTLKENNLVVVDDVLASTARFFANPCSFRTNYRVAKLANDLQKVVNDTFE